MKKPLDSNHRGGIDLHVHSTASDGTCRPSELIRMAAEMGLEAIAITDHDTLEGVCEVLSQSVPHTLRFLSGVEISTQPPSGFPIGGSLHILGYGIDPACKPLQDALRELQIAREARTPQIVAQLNELGIPITMHHVLARSGAGNAGRPHIASALIAMGAVKTIDQAFTKFLSKGRPAYVDKYRIPCRQAIKLIHLAGGVPVLAHPSLIPGVDQPGQLIGLLETLCGFGLEGIEAHYPEHPPEAETFYLEMARRFALLVTGGSDYHGDLTPDIQMGRGKGDMYVPRARYDALTARLSAKGRTPERI